MTKDSRLTLQGKPAFTFFGHFDLIKPQGMFLSEMSMVFAHTEQHKKQQQSYWMETVSRNVSINRRHQHASEPWQGRMLFP